MKDDIQYLRSRVDHIADTQSRQTAILEKNTESLAEHMRRTEALENRVEDHEFPFKVMRFIAYGLGLIATIAGAILSIQSLLN